MITGLEAQSNDFNVYVTKILTTAFSVIIWITTEYWEQETDIFWLSGSYPNFQYHIKCDVPTNSISCYNDMYLHHFNCKTVFDCETTKSTMGRKNYITDSIDH